MKFGEPGLDAGGVFFELLMDFRDAASDSGAEAIHDLVFDRFDDLKKPPKAGLAGAGIYFSFDHYSTLVFA